MLVGRTDAYYTIQLLDPVPHNGRHGIHNITWNR